MDTQAVRYAPGTEAAADLRRTLRNGVALTGAYVLPRACTFAAAVIAARALGIATFGVWGTAAALAVIMSVTATLGMMQLLVREIARAPERAAALIGAANLAKLIATVLMLAGIAVIAAGPLDFDGRGIAAAVLLGLAYAVGAFAENLGAWFQGTERMAVWMQAQTLFGLVSGGLGIVLALATRDLVSFCVAPLIGQFAALVWLLRAAPSGVRRARTAPFPEVRALVVALAPFAAAFLLLTAYYKIDILLLGRWRGASDAGEYAAAYRFVDVAQALSVVIASALYPRLSRIGRRAGESASRSLELLMLAAVPASALLWLIREPLVTFLFGERYLAAAGVLALLAPALPALALNALATFILAAAGRTGTVAAAYGSAILVNLTLNALWIPPLGAAGAARAMLASETLLAVIMSIALARSASARPRAVAVVPVLFAAILPVPLAAYGPRPPVAAWVYVVLIALLYFSFRVVPASERALFRRAVAG